MIEVGSRVFYFEGSDCHGFGTVLEISPYGYISEKFPSKNLNSRILLILKDETGEFEEFLETDCRLMAEFDDNE